MKISSKKSRKPLTLSAVSISRIILVIIGTIVMVSYFSGCKALPKPKPTIADSVAVNEKYVQVDKLTAVSMPGDSLTFKAIMECDSLNQLLIRSVYELKSERMNAAFSLDKGVFTYKAKTKPDVVYVKSTDKWYYIHKHITRTVTIARTVQVHVNTWSWLDWVGLITIIILVLHIIFKFSNEIYPLIQVSLVTLNAFS